MEENAASIVCLKKELEKLENIGFLIRDGKYYILKGD